MVDNTATHILAIRIKNRDILQKLSEVQDLFRKSNSDLAEAIPPLATAHITLNQFYLPEASDVMAARNILESESTRAVVDSVLSNDNNETGRYRNLVFSKLNDFHDQVVYVALQPDDTKLLKELVSRFRSVFSGYDLEPPVEKPFTPHLTAVNLNQCRESMNTKGIKSISKQLYANEKNIHFGEECFNEILLCKLCSFTEDGFLKIEGTFSVEH